MPDVTVTETPVHVAVTVVDDIATAAVVVTDPDIPSGGDEGEVLVKVSDSSFHVGWGSGAKSEPFSTVADMVASNKIFFQAECSSYLPGDRNFSVWVRTTSPYLLPSGSDVLQTARGLRMVRIFSRDGGDETVIPNPLLPSYIVSVPVVAPTIDDLRNGYYSAMLVLVVSPPYVYRRGNDNALDDVANGVFNAMGLHYDRHSFL